MVGGVGRRRSKVVGRFWLEKGTFWLERGYFCSGPRGSKIGRRRFWPETTFFGVHDRFYNFFFFGVWGGRWGW